MAFNYRVLQLASFFLCEYEYKRIIINGFLHENEFYIFDKNNPYYQLIHISDTPLDDYYKDAEKNSAIIEVVSKQSKITDLQFLDIHVTKEEVGIDLKDKCICIEEGYYSGDSLDNLYPGIRNQIHTVSDEETEKQQLEKKINTAFFKRARKNIKLLKKDYLVTYIVLVVCILNFIANLILSSKGYSDSAVSIFLGADYKTFTYGLKEYYRLFTYAFVHGSFSHLLCNMYSLFVIGRYIESRYGSLKYLIVLVGSVLCGSLVYGIFTTNGIVVGLSAFLYALLVMYVLEIIIDRQLMSRSLFYIIFINIVMNFLPNVGWQAHLGGAIFGFVCYYMFKDEKVNKSYIVLATIVILLLGIKYYSNSTINPIYPGTDIEVYNMKNDLISNKAGNKLLIKLNSFYKEKEQ